MKDIGIFLIKFSAFLFVGLGASIASIGLPLIEYEKEAMVYIYKAEESMGQTVNEESCVHDIAKDSFAECKTGLYLAKTYNSYIQQYAKIVNFLLRVGIISFLIGVLLYFKVVVTDRKKNANDRKTI